MARPPIAVPPPSPLPPSPPAAPSGTAPEPERDSLVTTWSRRDIIANQRIFLLRRDNDPRYLPPEPTNLGALAAPTGAPPSWTTDTSSDIPEPPGLPNKKQNMPTYAVYRYTRGINDLTNSGMGYGEPTEEKRCVPSNGGSPPVLTVKHVLMQRTRSGRQPLDKKTVAVVKARPEPASAPAADHPTLPPRAYDPSTNS